MTQHDVRGVGIEVESYGSEAAPAFLLIRGLSTQLIQWPDVFVGGLVEAGFRVVVFDNRDCGLSAKFDAAGTPSIQDLLSGNADVPYTLTDMARDTVGVLDALEIEKAHVAGISLGGMVTQHLAISHGERFYTATSIMSSSGAPGLPTATPEAMASLTARADDPDDREKVIELNMKGQRVIGSPGFPMSEEELRSYCERAYDRCYCPGGSARQMAAVLTDATRADRLSEISIPFQVLHGSEDPLIPLGCGEDTAKRVSGAALHTIKGMGHDISDLNSPHVVERLIAFAKANAE